MLLAAVIVNVLLALACFGSAFGKLTKNKQVVANLTKAGVPLSAYPTLAAVLIVGGVGVLVGLAVEAVGILATLGLVLYFFLGIIAHIRAKDFAPGPPHFFFGLALAAFVLRLLTL